ncbi:hypothetical protein [Brevundimonas sp. FT23028]|uniref:hypothetical protein n=1 Tax=Brevundimonas sp. FT23028 TaxID=3393748 RepID=UPI003B5899ED
MRRLLIAALLLAAPPALAQEAGPAGSHSQIRDPSAFGLDAVTPTRLASSRIEMNRGRNTRLPPSISTAAGHRQALNALQRIGAVCTLVETRVVGRTRSGRPLIEVDCQEGGGMIVADDDPVIAVDCLDLAPDAGQGGERRRVVSQCVLPANVAAVAAEPPPT